MLTHKSIFDDLEVLQLHHMSRLIWSLESVEGLWSVGNFGKMSSVFMWTSISAPKTYGRPTNLHRKERKRISDHVSQPES